MDISKFPYTDRAVAPVIGIVLMIALAVVVAGVISVGVGDITDSLSSENDDISLQVEYSSSDGYYTVTVLQGSNISMDEVSIDGGELLNDPETLSTGTILYINPTESITRIVHIGSGGERLLQDMNRHDVDLFEDEGEFDENGDENGEEEPLTGDDVDWYGEDPFIMTIDTEGGGYTSDDQFEIPINNNIEQEYNYTVIPDGEVTQSNDDLKYNEDSMVLTFEEPGIYQIEIYGDFPHLFQSSLNDDAPKVESIDQWGDIIWYNQARMFYGSENVTYEAEDTPDMQNVQSMNSMFQGAEELNGDISDWDTRNVEDMGHMFDGASSFNQDISGWDTSNVKETYYMFNGVSEFDQDLNEWDVSNVENMNSMFRFASEFNGEIDEWDTGNVEDGGSMFRHASSFNQDVSDWDTSNLVDMNSMFRNANEFDQDLNEWDVSNVENMDSTFENAWEFDGEIDEWDTGNVENMDSMFYNAGQFNRDISQWCVEQIDNQPPDFNTGAAMEDEDNKQPEWGEVC